LVISIAWLLRARSASTWCCTAAFLAWSIASSGERGKAEDCCRRGEEEGNAAAAAAGCCREAGVVGAEGIEGRRGIVFVGLGIAPV